jgi:ATP:ADP antiporter, AAA family
LPRPVTLLTRLLNVRAGEGRLLVRLWLVGLLFTAAAQIGDVAAQALFLKRVGAEHLPVMFVVKALLDATSAILYIPLAGRLGHRRTLAVVLGLSGLGMLLLWLPCRHELHFAYLLLYAWCEWIGTLLKIHWGVYLLDFYASENASRVFPLIYTGSRAGAILGGGLTSPLAPRIGTCNLIPLSGALFLLSTGLALSGPSVGDHTEAGAPLRGAGARIAHLRRGLALILGSPLIRAIATATALMVFCRYGLRLLYSSSLDLAFGEAELSSVFGFYLVMANAASILLQLAVTSRLLQYAGILLTNLLFSLAVLGGFLFIGLRPGLAGAVAARVVETELKAAIKTPLSNLFYGALPAADRAPGRALVLGLVVPAATLAIGLVLSYRPAAGPMRYWGTALAALFVMATWVQNQRYSAATDGTLR